MKLVNEQIEVIDTVLQLTFGFVRYSSKVWDDTLEEKTYPHIVDGSIDKILRVITHKEKPISYELLTRKTSNSSDHKLNDTILWKYDNPEKEPIKIIERRDVNNRLMIKEIKYDTRTIKQQLRYDGNRITGISIIVKGNSMSNYTVTNICGGNAYSFVYKTISGEIINVILDKMMQRYGHLTIIGKDGVIGVETVMRHKNGFRIVFWDEEEKTRIYSYAFHDKIDKLTKSLNREFEGMRKKYESK